MNMRHALKRLLVVGCFAFMLVAYSYGQATVAAPQTEHSLFETISEQDAALFNAVNRCDLVTVESMFDENLEFYHDKADPQYGRKVVVENIRKNLCGQIQRELVPGSLEVHPIQGYGAVEIGVHRFHHIGTQDRDVVGEAKFIHLWRFKDGSWQITRVISYDHGAAH
jgi:hypothetical protein